MLAAAALPIIAGLPAQPSAAAARVSDTYELQRERESTTESSEGSSASSEDRWTIIERVVAVRDGGLELEYDHPKETTAEQRASDWQLPARVFKRVDGPTKLLNEAELERRRDAWLKAAKLSPQMCGRWIFTWNAFRIECDPKAVIKTIEAYELGPRPVQEGAAYQLEGALGSAPLVKMRSGPNGATFSAEMKVDEESVRRARAEADVIAGEIMGKPVTFAAALQTRAKRAISGTVSVTLETDPAGLVWRRLVVTRLNLKQPNGAVESETITETLQRRRVDP